MENDNKKSVSNKFWVPRWQWGWACPWSCASVMINVIRTTSHIQLHLHSVVTNNQHAKQQNQFNINKANLLIAEASKKLIATYIWILVGLEWLVAWCSR